jgi:hypothetical protein
VARDDVEADLDDVGVAELSGMAVISKLRQMARWVAWRPAAPFPSPVLHIDRPYFHPHARPPWKV